MPNNRRSLLSISRPMNPDPINPKRIISTNNCRLANRQLSSRDGTYVYQCHANLTLSINFNLIQYHNLNPYPYHTFLQFPSISQIPTMQLLSSTLLSTSLTEYYINFSQSKPQYFTPFLSSILSNHCQNMVPVYHTIQELLPPLG